MSLKDVRPLGIFIIFEVQKSCTSNIDQENYNPSSDAFSLLTSNSKNVEKYLPEPWNETDSKKKLKKKFREFLPTNNTGWSKAGVLKYGKAFINTVSNCLWYLMATMRHLSGNLVVFL